MKNSIYPRLKNAGFTLIEMVLTIIVGGILVLGIAGFVELGTKGYAESVDRYRLQTQAKFIIEKMSREMRHAVPNILDNTGVFTQSCVRFYPIDYSGFYAVSGADLLFIVGTTGVQPNDVISGGRSLIINPTSMNDLSNAIALNSSSVSETDGTYTITNGASRLSSESVANRHYIYSKQVEYCITLNSPLIGRTETMIIDDTSSHAFVADSVEAGSFTYYPATLQRSGLVRFSLLFEQNSEETQYQHDVQVLNVP